MNVLSIVGLILAMFLLVFLAMKGIHVLAIGLICSSILAITSGMNIYTVLAESYMPGLQVTFWYSWQEPCSVSL
mgnify:CR=1 FL=1